MLKNQFIGTWRLLSCELKDDKGQVTYPFSPDAVGYIIYTETGYMSVNIMTTSNRIQFVNGNHDIAGGTTEEKIAAAETYFSYCGQYEIRDNKVIHHVKASLFPNEVGTDLERLFEFKDNKLLLMASFLGQTAYLTWERVT
ncbi:MAG: lipocalin-like domain-containing protein [Candidatus Parabeggiatoa sp.]|nr:lipocalin-like domain-containing protein [Candidatus Parabeggiatoa sp.]